MAPSYAARLLVKERKKMCGNIQSLQDHFSIIFHFVKLKALSSVSKTFDFAFRDKVVTVSRVFVVVVSQPMNSNCPNVQHLINFSRESGQETILLKKEEQENNSNQSEDCNALSAI